MKKYLLILASLLVLAGCSKKEADPYQSFRQYNSSKIFNDGEQALANRKYDKAAKNFEALDALYPFGPHAEQAQLDIIYAYYMDGDDASAITAADRYIHLYPRGANVDYAYYMRGVVGFNLGLSWLQKKVGIDPATRDVSTLQQSFSSFSMLDQEFPHSRYAADSLVRMSYIRNLLASREVDISKFYFEREAYVAAANRASYVVEHFQGSSQVEAALVMMVKSYRKLGLTQMADTSYKLLKTNFPASKSFHKLDKQHRA